MAWRYTVGLRKQNKSEHVVVEAEDALVAALRVKSECPEAMITYVRRYNQRGDRRNPPQKLAHMAENS
jgi:hypothetical protein